MSEISTQLEQFQALNEIASGFLQRSKQEFTKAFLALNKIREESLFAFGGYDSWNEYLDDFLDHNGVSRSLGYENLAPIRIAKRCAFSDDEIESYGLYTIKPWFEKRGPILKYNRRSGNIEEVHPEIEAKLPPGDSLNLRYGQYVKDQIVEGEPPSLVRKNIQKELAAFQAKFVPYHIDGKMMGIQWDYSQGEDWGEGIILFKDELKMPDIVLQEFYARLRVPKDFR